MFQEGIETRSFDPMLTLIALSAALMQTPPSRPLMEVRSRFVFVGAGDQGPGSIDADDDGQITREEFAAPLNDAFSKMDEDGDGHLSRDELAANTGAEDAHVTVRPLGDDIERFELRRRATRLERDGERTMIFVTPDGAGSEPHVIVRARPGGPDSERPGGIEFRRADRRGSNDLDKDGDGKVSEAEF
ncbi:MAG: hypothetical protein EON86_03690, partial [Brevundimonas sp.]